MKRFDLMNGPSIGIIDNMVADHVIILVPPVESVSEMEEIIDNLGPWTDPQNMLSYYKVMLIDDAMMRKVVFSCEGSSDSSQQEFDPSTSKLAVAFSKMFSKKFPDENDCDTAISVLKERKDYDHDYLEFLEDLRKFNVGLGTIPTLRDRLLFSGGVYCTSYGGTSIPFMVSSGQYYKDFDSYMEFQSEACNYLKSQEKELVMNAD